MLDQSPIWQRLKEHQRTLSLNPLQNLFKEDDNRFTHFSLEAAGIFLDFSKNYITLETIQYLIELANALCLPAQIEALFQLETPISHLKKQSISYISIRQFDRISPDNQMSLAAQNLRIQMKKIVDQIRNQVWTGFTGKPITDIVNVGIGGSDLGPRMVLDALKHYKNYKFRYHFISNADGTDLSELLCQLSPEKTLFLLSSKSFKTQETLCHASTIKSWLLQHGANHENIIEKHILAITAHPEKALAFGIHPDHILSFSEEISGRFSLWSSVGLPIAIAIGMEEFENLLKGAAEMDRHFCHQPLHQNMPVILALLNIWYINFWGTQIQAIVPYTQLLRYFPAYLQQLEMESNGKSVNKEGLPIRYSTAPSILGGVGTDVQHSFFQWLHQGTQWAPVDFIAVINPKHDLKKHQQLLLASCFAQSQVLMQGSSSMPELSSHQKMNGNRPSNTILLPELTPYTLGTLIALYEHKTVVEGMLWNINSFDQWGVELGKHSTEFLLKSLESGSIPQKQDASTKGLLKYYYSRVIDSVVLNEN